MVTFHIGLCRLDIGDWSLAVIPRQPSISRAVCHITLFNREIKIYDGYMDVRFLCG